MMSHTLICRCKGLTRTKTILGGRVKIMTIIETVF